MYMYMKVIARQLIRVENAGVHKSTPDCMAEKCGASMYSQCHINKT